MKWQAILFIKPQTKQSTMFGNRGCYTNPKKRLYVAQLKGLIERRKPAKLFKRLVCVDICIVLPSLNKDKTEWCWSDSRGDEDNFRKPIKDAMSGLVYEDDKQVCCGRTEVIRKRGTDGEIHIRVSNVGKSKPRCLLDLTKA